MANERYRPFVNSDDSLSIVEWFESIYKNIIKDEGWYIGAYNSGTDIGFDVRICLIGDEYPKLSYNEAADIAREYGWIVDNDNYIVGFNIENLIRNKHLLTGTELGLL